MRAGLLLAALLGLAGASHADDDWERALDRDGVVVDQQAVPGRGLPIFRATTRIGAPLEDVLAVIVDVERQPEWMPRFEQIRVLEREPMRAVFYVRMGMPWPVSDRDAVLDSDTMRPDADHSLTRFRLTESDDAPTVPGVVRMPLLEGHYALRRVDASTTEVEYKVNADPGGMLPDWLAAQGATDDPFQALKNLRKRATARRTR